MAILAISWLQSLLESQRKHKWLGWLQLFRVLLFRKEWLLINFTDFWNSLLNICLCPRVSPRNHTLITCHDHSELLLSFHLIFWKRRGLFPYRHSIIDFSVCGDAWIHFPDLFVDVTIGVVSGCGCCDFLINSSILIIICLFRLNMQYLVFLPLVNVLEEELRRTSMHFVRTRKDLPYLAHKTLHIGKSLAFLSSQAGSLK